MKQNKLNKDISFLVLFINLYCVHKHPSRPKQIFSYSQRALHLNQDAFPKLCRECSDLLEYSITQRIQCPFTPKPSCKKCSIHCYSSEFRSQIKKVMKFSGLHLVKHGRLDMLYYYLLQHLP